MLSIQALNAGMAAARLIGMKHLNIKKNERCQRPQKPIAWMSARASSLLLESGTIFSPMSGSSMGSLSTFVHTSLRQLAVMSRIIISGYH